MYYEVYPINATTFTLNTHPLVIRNIYGQHQVRYASHDIDRIEVYIGQQQSPYYVIPNFVRDEPIIPEVNGVYTVTWTIPYIPGVTYAMVHYWRPPVTPIWQS